MIDTKQLWISRHVLLVLAAALLVGCGGETGENKAAADPAAETGTAEDNPSSAPDAATGTAVEDPQTQSGPESGTGMQLPDAAVPVDAAADPEAAAPESGGPAQPGSGGIEMPEVTPAEPADPSASTGPTDSAATNLQFASWSEIESQAKSTGRITVVDLWSTSCEPCLKEFPGLVKLSKSMADQVTCISVSVDYDGRKTRPPESYSEKVGAILTAFGAGFDNYLCNTPSDDVFTTLGLPSIPAVLIFDGEGKLVKKFVDAGETIGFSYESDVVPFVKELAG